jgi:hypothetical protein
MIPNNDQLNYSSKQKYDTEFNKNWFNFYPSIDLELKIREFLPRKIGLNKNINFNNFVLQM